MVVGWEGVPNTILEVMVLTMGKVLCVAHGHLLTAVPAKRRGQVRGGTRELQQQQKCCTAGVVGGKSSVLLMWGIRLNSAAQGNCHSCQGHFLTRMTNHNVTAYEKIL